MWCYLVVDAENSAPEVQMIRKGDPSRNRMLCFRRGPIPQQMDSYVASLSLLFPASAANDNQFVPGLAAATSNRSVNSDLFGGIFAESSAIVGRSRGDKVVVGSSLSDTVVSLKS